MLPQKVSFSGMASTDLVEAIGVALEAFLSLGVAQVNEKEPPPFEFEHASNDPAGQEIGPRHDGE
ncbi:hypothetical protein AWB78_07138 [Caballeronia calidae]|uniref:Uncharacterized protein n=1 Tax=Caballeronia calidae TaxID=1777139 RepID=A0A158EDA6_9BURK|nr:hypothetical protein AWB78_07138 [Caballeronia calidae]